MKNSWIVFLVSILLLDGYIALITRPHKIAKESSQKVPVTQPIPSSLSQSSFAGPIEPVAEFTQRITKKPFGIYITPQTSPVQPERFTGYHTGVDVEYTDMTDKVPVHAIADGKVVVARFASGCGGVVAIEHSLNGRTIFAIYGHLKPTSLVKVGTSVHVGDEIGELGADHSAETDGERRHLHFGIVLKGSIDLRGYVPTKGELSGWMDPLDLYKN